MPAAELKPGLLKHKQEKKDEISPEEQLLWENHDTCKFSRKLQNMLQVVEESIYLLFPFFPKKK